MFSIEYKTMKYIANDDGNNYLIVLSVRLQRLHEKGTRITTKWQYLVGVFWKCSYTYQGYLAYNPSISYIFKNDKLLLTKHYCEKK